MNSGQKACDTGTIERFLEGRLDAGELSAFEQHLEDCPACRERLESRAADADWWSDARDYLPRDCAATVGVDFDGRSTPSRGEILRNRELLADAVDVDALLAMVKPYLTPTDDPRMLGRVGAYEVMGIIGAGGNGIVLKGFDAALNRAVAIKLMSPRLADSGTARRRFSREAQAAAAVVHDNVMAIHAVSETIGLPYLVMPYVRGPSLERRLRNTGPLAVPEVLRIGMQVAAGLAAAHAQGLVHRDIKPANILLEEGVERVKITDFGLARAADDASLTRSGVIAGTPQYMSPEQARGEAVDHRTDLFSLGSVLYASCTGRSPFRAESSYGVLRKICDAEPRSVRELNPAVPLWLVRIIDRLLAKEAQRRYASAGEVAALLELCLAHVQQPTAVALPAALAERKAKRVKTPVVVFATAVAAFAAIAASLQHVPRAHEQIAANAPVVPPPHGWNDGVELRLEKLSSDISRLQADGGLDLWNDTVALRIERLRKSVAALESELGTPQTPASE